MNLHSQSGGNASTALPLVSTAELRQSYRRMRVAAKPVRRLVKNPNEVSSAVPPAVQAYLPAVNDLIASLAAIDLACTSSWTARLVRQQQAAQASAAAALQANAGVQKVELISDSYQTFAALFNSCVDAYHEVVDSI